MVSRTASATAVEMATILFCIAIAPRLLVKIPSGPEQANRNLLPVHLSLIVCAVLSALRAQTIENRRPARFGLPTFINETIRHSATNSPAALNLRHCGCFPRNVRTRRGNPYDAENVNDGNHHSKDDGYRKHPCHPEIDHGCQLNGFRRWDTCGNNFDQKIGLQKPA